MNDLRVFSLFGDVSLFGDFERRSVLANRSRKLGLLESLSAAFETVLTIFFYKNKMKK